MLKIKKILFPIDLADDNSKVIPYVKSMAEKYGAQVELLYVEPDFVEHVGIYLPHMKLEKLSEEMAAGAKRKMDEFAQQNLQQRSDGIKTHVMTGDAARRILEFVKDKGVDLVIMGTHGRKGLEHLFFGSVAEKVVKNCPVPVLTVNPYKVNQSLDVGLASAAV